MFTSTHLWSNMALTAEEFLRISKAQRAEQLVEDAKIRAEERASDLTEINKMIESGVKTEVERVLGPLQSKNEERFSTLESDMADLKKLLKPGPSFQFPPVQPVAGPHSDVPPLRAWPTNSAAMPSPAPTHTHPPSDAIATTISKAKRIISLEPINKKRDVERQYRQKEGITNDNQAMYAAVLEYLEDELKCKGEDVPNIVSIFPPVNSQNYDRLYVEFQDEISASYVASFARLLRKNDHQVSIYVPKCFQSRFQALNIYAKSIRTASGLNPGDIKTRIKYGKTDFILLTKPRNGRWTEAQLWPDNFPPLQPPGQPEQSGASPPPGRLRGSPSPPGNKRGSPPPPGNKRGAPSPLERSAKASRSSENHGTDGMHSPTPKSPPHTPTLAAGTSTPSQKSPARPSPAPLSLLAAAPSLDSGTFGQTAVSSPKLNTNQHFTFETRRMSLPSSTGQRNLN